MRAISSATMRSTSGGRWRSSHSVSAGRSNSRVSPSSEVSPARTICGAAGGSAIIASAASDRASRRGVFAQQRGAFLFGFHHGRSGQVQHVLGGFFRHARRGGDAGHLAVARDHFLDRIENILNRGFALLAHQPCPIACRITSISLRRRG
jgi:hypothetical protein